MSYQRIQLRRDTAARWAMANPVLAQGEPGYETDTGRQKIGNGTAKWTALPYAGEQGPVGPAGPEGKVGPQGERGGKGDRGAQGPIGASGPATVLSIGTVVTGPVASATLTGVAPSQTLSLVLPRGERGEVGPQGPIGIQGPQGEAAGVVIKGKATRWPPASDPDIGDIYIIPTPLPVWVPAGYVSGDAALWDGDEWMNAGPIQGPRGEKGEKGDQGLPGINGSIGPTGPSGPANTLTIGSVTEAAVGSQPAVIITGNSPAQTLSFILPAAKPNTLTIGSVTQGLTAAAEIVGTAPNQILNLVLPNPAIFNSTSFSVNPRDASVIEGETVTFTASANSTEFPIVYSWQSSTDGNTWSDIDGSGNETLTFASDTTQNDRLYRCSAATPSVGRVYSQIARLKVAALPGLGNGAQRLRVGFRNDIAILGAYDWFIGPDMWFAGGRLYLRKHTSSDGINWEPMIGGPDANWGGAFNAVRYGRGFWFMVGEGQDGDPTSVAPTRERLLSSDGVNWQRFATDSNDPDFIKWTRYGKCVPNYTGQGFDWNHEYLGPEDGYRGARSDDLVTVDSIYLANSVCTYLASHESLAYGTRRRWSASGWYDVGFIGGADNSPPEAITGGNTGMVNGTEYRVGMGQTRWWLLPMSGSMTSRARPTGFDMHPPAYANGYWLGTHRTQPGVYYTSQDLTNWTAHTAVIPGFDMSQYLLGRPYALGGKFVMSLMLQGSKQLEAVLYSD